jgi:hypothetical protein
MSIDIDILNVSPTDNWSADKKRHWAKLKIMVQRILEKKEDITSNLGADHYAITYTFAAFDQDKDANTLFHQVSALAADYDYDRCEDFYQKGVKETKYKSLKRFLEICRFHSIDTNFEDEATPKEESKKDYIPDGVDYNFFENYGFYELKNTYYTLESSGNGKWKAVAFTNFKMEVLFHMDKGVKPRRTIQITNDRGKTRRVNVETDRMVSKNEFKKLCEGYGNFRFWGSDGKLDMLKSYLYDQERPAVEIKELGWNEDGFWAWSNGIFNAKFHKLDMNGYVELHSKHYIIPAGNHDEPGRNRRFSNEIRFRHFEDQMATFTEWSRLYCEVFPINGSIILIFSVSCLFSDIVFDKKQFFPLLFIYGEGGSGKGSAIKMAQRLYGVPQDPLTLSGKANTDKAKIAIFAQFINTMLLLEEYTPNHDTDQLLKNLWDRYGYKRRTMDMGYGTETVPIQSGVAVTANFTPSDDPLLQRLIYLDHNTNSFTQEEHVRFNKLKEYSEKGITTCTHELLAKRPIIEAQFREKQLETYKELRSKNSNLATCTDRMIENISVLITIYTILSDNLVNFPFTREALVDDLVTTIVKQNEKRDSGGEVQKFFDIFQSAASKGELLENVHYKIDQKHLMFNVKQVYGVYALYHRSFYNTPGLTLGNLRDKLKIHAAYSGYKDVARIGEANSSAYLFHYDKIGIDLIAADKVYKGARKSRNNMQENYENKVSEVKEVQRDIWEPAEDGPL